MRLRSLLFSLIAFLAFNQNAFAQFTSNSTSTATKAVKTVSATPKANVRPTVRPTARPATVSATEQAEGDDALPSFEVFDNSKSASANGTANIEPPPPPPPPVGEIWFYTTDFTTDQSADNSMSCSWKWIYQNRSDTKITKLRLQYKILGEEFAAVVRGLAPGKAKVVPATAYSKKCPAMRGVKPQISVAYCKFGIMKDEGCRSYIKVK